MPFVARYVHTNLIAADWRRLARFYEEVFHCIHVPPKRDFQGAKLEALTGLPTARLRGVHLRLPGYGSDGPTLEIFSYTPSLEKATPAANRQGYGHIAFEVDDVAATYEAVIQGGGQPLGEIVTLEVAAGDQVTVCYMTDPEGNILELQSWSRAQTA